MTDNPTIPPRPTDSNLRQHAWDELNRAGMFDPDPNYDGMLGRAVLDLITVFAGQGHSNGSAWAVLSMFERLARFQPLSDLTDDPTEWLEVTDGTWQSRRMSEAFSLDGGKTYTLVSDADHTVHKSKPHKEVRA